MIAGGECQEARTQAASLFANCHAAGLQVWRHHPLHALPPPNPRPRLCLLRLVVDHMIHPLGVLRCVYIDRQPAPRACHDWALDHIIWSRVCPTM